MAKFKAIKNLRDYEEALEEIERLWDAEEDTPEGERLNRLSELVEAWERQHPEAATLR